MTPALETFVPLQFTHGRGRQFADTGTAAPDVRIIEAIARAMHWQSLLDSGAVARVRDIAQAEGLKPTSVGRIMRLARLSPDLIEELMAGRQPRRLTLYWLMRHDLPALWSEQRRVFAELN